jgi:hypothetical protein
MPLTYADSSAVVKRYVPEAGSRWVVELCEREQLALSLLAIPEVASALSRRAREGTLTAAQRDTLFRLFMADTGGYALVTFTQTVAQRAARLLLQAPPQVRLRALDAIHLASALHAFARARRRGVATGDFVSADAHLLAAGQWAGLSTQNPEAQT